MRVLFIVLAFAAFLAYNSADTIIKVLPANTAQQAALSYALDQ